LAADSCSGNSIYEFSYFTGSIGSLGCENANAKTILSVTSNAVNLGILSVWRPDLTDNFKQVIYVESADLNISHVVITNITDISNLNKDFIRFNDGRAYIKTYKSNVKFINHDNGIDNTSNTLGNALILEDYAVSGIKIDYKKRPFIGNNPMLRPSNSQLSNDYLGRAIFTNTNGAPYKDSAGNSFEWNGLPQGCWFMETDPNKYNIAGYVSLTGIANGSQATNAKVRRMPLILFGTTSDRPAIPTIGMMFFDTTLGKPIWAKTVTSNGDGTYTATWVDATGATV
jgi:hypothetical protein